MARTAKSYLPGSSYCNEFCGILSKLVIHPDLEMLPMDRHTFKSKTFRTTGIEVAWKKLMNTKVFCGVEPMKCDTDEKKRIDCKPGKVCVGGLMGGYEVCLPADSVKDLPMD